MKAELGRAARGIDRQSSDAAAAVVRHQHVVAGPVHDEVARPRAARRLLVDQGQLAGGLIDRKPEHSPARGPSASSRSLTA